ncbi:MAG TPA: patatin-like phospholipase family protein, partial [Polyangiaceae bacterium]|nr:patatin-like phospholipase family protein [Polyangiaceae bacterium]
DTTSVEDRIIGCWKDLSAQTPQEILLDKMGVGFLRLVERGLIPSIASSPSSPQFRLWSEVVASFVSRPEYTNLGVLLSKHIDFDTLPAVVEPDSPVLLVGAADVLKGSFKVFSSALGEINLDALLASAAIPNLFPAVWVDGHAYWDGIFSSNPPIVAFLQKAYMGKHRLPEEIWIIQINRSEHDAVPERPSDILDRRNHLSGNLSLQHELQLIEMVNLLIREDALTDRFRARFGLDTTEPITVRFIRMSAELQRGLDYPSKLSRQPDHIENLIADGEAQAKAFLAGLDDSSRRGKTSGEEAPVELQ